MRIYKKISTINYIVIEQYKDIINYIGEVKYNQQKILDKFENDFSNRRLEYDKILYYHKYLKKIFCNIVTMCDIEDDDYISFKENTDMLINILDSNIRIPEEDIWKILNKHVYNVENKMISLASMLILTKEGYSVDVRKIIANKGSMYKVRYSCALKRYNGLFFRIYYSDYDNKTYLKVFPSNPIYDEMEDNRVEIKSEKQLDDILNRHLKI